MRFPVIVKHRRARATIYGRSKGHPYYRVAWHAGGKRLVRSFATYGAAKEEAERVVRELAQGSQTPALSAKDASSAIEAREALEAFKRDTSRTVTPHEAVTGYLDALRKLGGHSLSDAVETFLRTAASVRRKDLAEAVEEFITLRAPLAEAKEGKRPARSPVYLANVSAWLRELAAAFPGSGISDLSKQHLDAYFTSPGLKALAPKSRNDRRAALKMFLAWAVKKDWLAPNHRLLEADGMSRETVDAGEIDFYRPREFRGLLDHADAALVPVLALCGLAGLRTEEALRLDWADVWRVAGHVEITRTKSKGRARRLVPIGPALAAWLEPYRDHSGPVWPGNRAAFFTAFAGLRDELKIASRENGLRHAFATYSFAMSGNENSVAAEMGNSPAMIHAHYRGLATRKEAEAWFNVSPAGGAENVIPLAKAAAP